MEIRVTADTNILASGSSHTSTTSAPVQFMKEWEQERFTLVLSEHIFGELDRTLRQRYYSRRLSAEQRARYLWTLRSKSVITPLTRTVMGVASHSEDDLVLATAVSGNAKFLVTGDHRLLALKQYGEVIIVSVHAFLDLLPGLDRVDGWPGQAAAEPHPATSSSAILRGTGGIPAWKATAMSSTPDTRTMSLEEARRGLDDVVREINDGRERVVLERDGTPAAALISLADLDRLRRADAQRERDFTAITGLRQYFADIPEEELEREIADAITAARAENRAGHEQHTRTA